MAQIFSSKTIRIVCLIGVWAVSQTILVSNSWAQSRVCRQLEQRLSQVSTGNFAAPSRRYRQYENAIQEQRAQMSITQRIARRNGCRLNLASGSGRCGRLNSSLRQMKANLAELQKTLNRLRPARGNAGAERRNILRTMQRNGCIDRRVEKREVNVRREKPKRRSLMEQIFGQRTFRENSGQIDDNFDGFSEPGQFRSGTFRTMCVRTCDGYYFPISFSTTQDQFSEDAEICQNRCPGGEVQLFFHGMPNQSPEQMISYRTDTPYADQPFAFAYRKKINPQCSCNFSEAKLTEIPGFQPDRLDDLDPIKEEEKPDRIGLPVYRQDRFLSPEAVSNGIGTFKMADLIKLGAPATPKNTDKFVENGKSSRIRIVGPAFFPVQ